MGLKGSKAKNIIMPLGIFILVYLSILSNAPMPRPYRILKEKNYEIDFELAGLPESAVIKGPIEIEGKAFIRKPSNERDYSIQNIEVKVEFAAVTWSSIFGNYRYELVSEKVRAQGGGEGFKVSLAIPSFDNAVNPSEVKLKFFGFYTNSTLDIKNEQIYIGERKLIYSNPQYALEVISPKSKEKVTGSFDVKGRVFCRDEKKDPAGCKIENMAVLAMYFDDSYDFRKTRINAKGTADDFTLSVPAEEFSAVKKSFTLKFVFLGTIDGTPHSFSSGAPYELVYTK